MNQVTGSKYLILNVGTLMRLNGIYGHGKKENKMILRLVETTYPTQFVA
jgi:hypothetical protein